MRCVNYLVIGTLGLALSSTVAAQAKRQHSEVVEHSLGSLEVPGACPAVPSYAEQLKQGRALSWRAGRVDVEARLFTNQPVGDRKTRLQLRDCTVSAGKAMPRELLAAVSRSGETALTEGVNQCLRSAGSDLAIVDTSLRRSAPACN